MKLKYIFLVAIVLLITACGKKPVFTDYQSVKTETWHYKQALVFHANINDTINTHDIVLHVRNSTNYPYQNFWMFIESTSPSGINQTDTIECILADNMGKWLGHGFTSVREVSVMYLENIRFPEIGEYSFSIAHGMRQPNLTGIESIGMTIEKRE